MSFNGEKDLSVYSGLKLQVCVVGESLKQNEDLIKAIEYFQLPIVYSSSGFELIKEGGGGFTTIFILDEFEGEVFTCLLKAGQRILGPTAVMQYANNKQPALPNRIHPTYTTSMKNIVVTFSGFRSKEELSGVVDIVRYMGGRITREFSFTRTTHLVATSNAVHGEKYKFAIEKDIPIMTVEWLQQAWTRRQDVNCCAINEALQYQSKSECGKLIFQVRILLQIGLSDILKHTSKSNPYYQSLEKENQALHDVIMHINEDERKTQGQMETFDDDVENCPLCQSNPGCERQTLLIFPVISLLDCTLKLTRKSTPHYQSLEKVTQVLRGVVMHMNVDERKNEGQMEIFDIVNDIDNYPPNLPSLNKMLVSKTDMQEVTDLLNKKGVPITMFLFADVLEICKKQSKVANHTMKSPGVVVGTLKAQSKSYKHLDLIPLSHIKKVVDVVDTDEYKNIFAVIFWSSKELKELLHAFVLVETVCKRDFLRNLCCQVANSMCKADSENLLIYIEPHRLDLHVNENTGNVLTKAWNITRNKLGRRRDLTGDTNLAQSMKTPTKHGLSWAVSTIINPLQHFGTPDNHDLNTRLPSVTNLTVAADQVKMSFNGEKDLSVYSGLKLQVCVVGESLKQNEDLIKAIEYFQLPIVYSSSGLELIKEGGGGFTTIFILDEFEGEVFTCLLKAGQRILGPTAVMQYANNEESALPNRIRPTYTTSMKNIVVTFSGFRSKEELSGVVDIVHYMGGSIRREFSFTRTTHLVATSNAVHGEKYKFAAATDIPIMTVEWVQQAWARRRDANCYATNEELMQYKMLPFVGCKLAFIGYQKAEEQHMIDICIKNGGQVTDPKDPQCTHIIVENGFIVHNSEFECGLILKHEWFWTCVQLEVKAKEEIYAFQNPNITSSSLVMPIRGNKRKRLESVAHQLALESQELDIFNLNTDFKRRPADAKLSISGSFLDATFSPDKTLENSPDNELDNHIKSPPIDMRSLSPRQQVCFELCQTENNYVGILHTIITVFMEPLQNDQSCGSLLAPAEIKIIFGNLPPIYEIHQKIRKELTEVIHSWSEDHSIGNLILNHASDLLKSYPPFVNFFEKTKSVLASCDATKPRFHAFLKRCQSKPECGRQTLQELLIRPVQRLPSVILLLGDILKHTPKSNPDYQSLEKAIQALRDVMMHINEDKRKTEGQMEMFDIVNDIENCPPNLLSSHRVLVSKTDMQEVTDLLNKKGGPITMFLFTDVLEICKKRSKVANHSMKSPGVVSLASGTLKAQSKSYKHLDLIPLSHIKRVVDVVDTDVFKNIFAVVTWSSKELKELLHAFVLVEPVCKTDFLRNLCRQVANSVCKADSENLLTCLEPHQLDLHVNESTGNVLTKALNITRNKLGRALSMRRTPTKRGLSRAVSTIISPLRHFGTPAHHYSNIRLSSVTNLTELVPSGSNLSPSPAGGKKMRNSSSLGVNSTQYL